VTTTIRLALVAAFCAAAPMAAQQVTGSASGTYANGRYFFAERYESWSLLGSLSIDWRRVSLSASVPVVWQDGTVLTRIGGVPIPTGGPEAGVIQRRQRNQQIPTRAGRRGGYGNATIAIPVSSATGDGPTPMWPLAQTESATADSLTVTAPGAMAVNMADPVFGGSVTVLESGDRRQRLSFEGWAKAPVASIASGVGTGAWDYAVGASTSLQSGTLLVSTSATWWTLGDLPDLEIRDALFYALSLGTTVGSHWGIHGGVSGATRLMESAAPPATATFSLMRFFDGRSLAANVGVGLTETAADLTVGLSISASSRPRNER
jgi:hypothetical protein